MKTCTTCRHWQPISDDEQTIRGAGECAAAPAIWEVTDQVEPDDRPWETHRVLKPAHAAVLAVVEDGSCYRARLITMPGFGCVQHAPRD